MFDSQLTTYANLVRLHEMGITFMTLRRRSPALLKEIALLPRSAWRTVELDVPTRKYRTPRVFDQSTRIVGQQDGGLVVAEILDEHRGCANCSCSTLKRRSTSRS